MPLAASCPPVSRSFRTVPNSTATLALVLARAQLPELQFHFLRRTGSSAGLLPRLQSRFPCETKSSSFTMSRRHTVSTTMSSRSAKKLSASVPSPPPTARQQDQDNDTSPPKQEKQDYQDITAPRPRRSSRRTGTNSTGNVKGAAVAPTRANLETMKESGIPASIAVRKLEKKAKDTQVDADHAIESLEDLELVFRRDTKRRKLQVETSIISSHDDAADGAFRPRMPRGESMVLQTGRLLLTPERDVGDAEEEAANAVAGEQGDPQEDALEPVERGAKRAPAVNSDYLPLPWKGRLGYVSWLYTLCAHILREVKLTFFPFSSIGMSEYVFACRKTPCLQLTDVSHCFHHRASLPAGRSFTARARYKEQARQDQAARHNTGPAVGGGLGFGQRA